MITSTEILRDSAERVRDRQEDARNGDSGDAGDGEVTIGDSSVCWALLTRMTVTAGRSPVLRVR
jgi:hypothetical protein